MNIGEERTISLSEYASSLRVDSVREMIFSRRSLSNSQMIVPSAQWLFFSPKTVEFGAPKLPWNTATCACRISKRDRSAYRGESKRLRPLILGTFCHGLPREPPCLVSFLETSLLYATLSWCVLFASRGARRAEEPGFLFPSYPCLFPSLRFSPLATAHRK